MTRKELMEQLPLPRWYGDEGQRGWLLDCLVQLDLIKLSNDEPKEQMVACTEDEDWNWWLLQSSEFKGRAAQALRKILE